MEKVCEELIKNFNMHLIENFQATKEIQLYAFVPNYIVSCPYFPHEKSLAA
jgi:hypothetical protein